MHLLQQHKLYTITVLETGQRLYQLNKTINKCISVADSMLKLQQN